MAEKEEVKEQPTVDNTVEKLKIKKKPSMKKMKTDTDGVTKIDLKELATKAEEVTKVDLTKETTKDIQEDNSSEQDVVKVNEDKPVVEEQVQETSVIEEITDEVDEVAEVASEAIKENLATGKKLPEGVEKLVSFMEDTGGDVSDYVKLNKDYSEMDNLTLLKSKYYQDIKAGSKLTEEQQKAIDFFGRHNKEEAENKEVADKQKSSFLNKTENVFNDKFKGFEYNVGDKKFRFNVNNASEVKNTQGDINNFVKKFLNESGEISDAKGYHKSLYTAMNADAIAKHFYEQGQTDAMKNSVSNAKNIDMSPRQSHGGEINAGGMRVKVLGDNSADFKFKIKSKNK